MAATPAAAPIALQLFLRSQEIQLQLFGANLLAMNIKQQWGAYSEEQRNAIKNDLILCIKEVIII